MKQTIPVLALLIGACSPQPPAVPVATPSASLAPSVAPTAPGSTAPGSPAATASAPTTAGPVHGLVAVATGPNGALAGADVKVFRLGQTAAFATGKSGTNGAFLVDLGAGFPLDAPVQVVATHGGQTVVAMGKAGIVATGGGNIVATGGGNIVATGGGNFNAAGIVATGGGNIVATGGGNWGLLQAAASPDPAVQQVDPAGALTWALLGARFRGAGQALTLPGSGDVLRQDLANLDLAYGTLVDASRKAIGSISAQDVQKLLGGFDANGKATLDPALATNLGTAPGLRDAFQRAAILANDAITKGIADGGLKPSADTLQRIDFAGASADAIDPNAVGTQPGEQGARDDDSGSHDNI
jgi:hypothetical protein